MFQILNALIPIFSLIALGYFFKKIKFPSYDFWPLADKLTYFVLMPCLLIYKLSTASQQSNIDIYYFLTPIISIFLVFIILLFINIFFKFDSSSFTSIVQGGMRFNTYIFLAICDILFDDKGLLLAAILLPFVIIFINILCITTFALYMNEKKLTISYFLKSIFTNPLIISCFIGTFIHFLNIQLPISLLNTFDIIGKTALPMGLLSIGFALVLKEMKTTKNEVFLSSLIKFILLPMSILFFANLFSLDKQMIAVLLIFAVVPTAPSSFVLARQLGGNLNLMSSIITIQTLISIISISFALEYLGF